MKKSWMVILILFSLAGVVNLNNKVQASEQYPVKPITFIVPNEPGADADVLVRPLLQRVSTILGKPIIVVNKPGGGNTIGYREIYQAKPDGYTIGLSTLTLVTNRLQGLSPIDYRDFTLIGSFTAQYPMIIASTKTQRPFRTVQEAFSFAKSNPGEVSMATTAVGGTWWIAAMLIVDRTGLKFNMIPQAGSGAFVVTQLAGGHADIGVTGAPSAMPQIDAGNLRPLATLGISRIPGKYDYVPTLKEAGYDISVHSFIAAMGPPKIPKDITEKLVKAFESGANHPDYRKFILSRNDTPHYAAPEAFSIFCEEQRKIYRTIFDKAGVLKEK